MWPTVEDRATPRRRPQSKDVPPWRPRSSVAESDPMPTSHPAVARTLQQITTERKRLVPPVSGRNSAMLSFLLLFGLRR